MPYTLELLKHCITLSGDFWDVRAFFLLLCSALWVDNNRESNNGILEATSLRGWFKLNCPFLFRRAFNFTDMLRDCRKSPKMAISAISHLIISMTYKRQNHRFRVFRQSLRVYAIIGRIINN